MKRNANFSWVSKQLNEVYDGGHYRLPNLFVIEGPDGSGKTSVATGVVERLEKKGLKVAYIKEPGTTPAGEEIRNILLNRKDLLSAPTQFMLFAAARQEILSYINANSDTLFILDRYIESTIVYQVLVPIVRGSMNTPFLSSDLMRLLERLVTLGLWSLPKKTYFLARSADASWASASETPNVYELQGKDFHETVCAAYSYLIAFIETLRIGEYAVVANNGLIEEAIGTIVNDVLGESNHRQKD